MYDNKARGLLQIWLAMDLWSTWRVADNGSIINVDAGERLISGWYTSHVSYTSVEQSTVVREGKRTTRGGSYKVSPTAHSIIIIIIILIVIINTNWVTPCLSPLSGHLTLVNDYIPLALKERLKDVSSNVIWKCTRYNNINNHLSFRHCI